ncbi:MAG TPA: hypothetical protein VMM56_01485 [Planctomycetaceae bacterium]|nr:hypothetical protein [Planctomycetaceae bacterium]
MVVLRLCCLAVLLSCSASSLVQAEEPAKYPVLWAITEGLSSPESAYFDKESGFLFLSQIGEGGGAGKDGDGWISKLSFDGKLVNNKWVTGFNAPKGLRSHKGTLWVSDIDRIVAIDIAKGEISKIVPVPDAKFLNDLACGPDGTVYVADMVASRIFRYQNSRLDVLAEGEQLEHPNGLLVVGDDLILGAWGQNFKEDFSTDPLGRLLRLNLKTKQITPITPDPTGNLDGVEIDGCGGFLVTDWRAGKVFHISAEGKSKLLMSFPRGAADHAFLTQSKTLILPHMLNNSLTAYDLSSLFE